MTLLYKYRSVDDWTRKIIVDNELYFASPHSFNDPFDCRINLLDNVDHESLRPMMLQAAAQRPIKVSREIIKRGTHEPYDTLNPADAISLMITNAVDDDRLLYRNIDASVSRIREYVGGLGVLCMSREQSNILMFSHYAASHRGIALGFDGEQLSQSFGNYTPVVYSDEMPEVSVLNPLDLFYVKARLWEYEHEVRFLSPSFGAKSMPETCLKTVILGCEITLEDERTVRNWIQASGRKIRLLRARKVRRDFRLRVIKPDEPSSGASEA